MVSTRHTFGHIGEVRHSQKSYETKCQAQPKATHENKLCDTVIHCETRQMVPETLANN
jgi:hypothetical protein